MREYSILGGIGSDLLLMDLFISLFHSQGDNSLAEFLGLDDNDS